LEDISLKSIAQVYSDWYMYKTISVPFSQQRVVHHHLYGASHGHNQIYPMTICKLPGPLTWILHTSKEDYF